MQNTYHFFPGTSFFRAQGLKGASNAAHVRVVGPCRKARNKHILDHLLSYWNRQSSSHTLALKHRRVFASTRGSRRRKHPAALKALEALSISYLRLRSGRVKYNQLRVCPSTCFLLKSYKIMPKLFWFNSFHILFQSKSLKWIIMTLIGLKKVS